MGDVRITGIAIPDTPDQYDARNEAAFRRAVGALKTQIDNALQRLKTDAQDGVVFTSGDQTIAGDKTFTDNIIVEDRFSITGGATVIATIQAGSAGAQLRFNSEADDLRWIIVLNDDDDDGDNDGGNLRFVARTDAGGAIGNALTLERDTLDATFAGGVRIEGVTDMNAAASITISSSTILDAKSTGQSGIVALGKDANGTAPAGGTLQLRFRNEGTSRWILLMNDDDNDGDDDGAELAFYFYEDDGTFKARTIRMDRVGNGRLGFFNKAPQAKPTGVAVSAAGIHAALVTLGLISG